MGFQMTGNGFSPPWFCITIAAEKRSVLSSDRSATLFSAAHAFPVRTPSFLQAEISGIDLHAVIFMVEQAIQNVDAFASGFVAAQVFFASLFRCPCSVLAARLLSLTFFLSP